MSCTRTIYQAIEEAILEYTDGTGRIYSEQEEGLWNIADRTAAALTQAPQIIRTVEELEALNPDTVMWPARHYGPYEVGTIAPDPFNPDWTPPLPAVVVATGSHVRACREALEGETT